MGVSDRLIWVSHRLVNNRAGGKGTMRIWGKLLSGLRKLVGSCLRNRLLLVSRVFCIDVERRTTRSGTSAADVQTAIS
jgi:hypothetical protein